MVYLNLVTWIMIISWALHHDKPALVFLDSIFFARPRSCFSDMEFLRSYWQFYWRNSSCIQTLKLIFRLNRYLTILWKPVRTLITKYAMSSLHVWFFWTNTFLINHLFPTLFLTKSSLVLPSLVSACPLPQFVLWSNAARAPRTSMPE